ncbi:MAG: peptidoglycan editing factor PgeF [Pseudomonadota bacterium]
MNSLPSVQSELLNGVPLVAHAFFGRRGGSSCGSFGSLNASQFAGDDPDNLASNRTRIMRHLHAHSLFSNKQVHGRMVRVIDSTSAVDDVHEADGLVTDQPGTVLGVLGADCAPVLFADPNTGIIGAAHAGWGGALRGVCESVVESMIDLGARVSAIRVAVGPAIQLESYEVGEKFKANVVETSPVDAAHCFAKRGPSGTEHFDLAGYIRLRLAAAGILEIDNLAIDTYSNETDYFSYRRACHRGESGYGRQMSAICLQSG